MSECFQGDLESGNNAAAPYPGHFFPFRCVLYCVVTWETELKGRRKVVGICQRQKNSCIKSTVNAYIKKINKSAMSQINQIQPVTF